MSDPAQEELDRYFHQKQHTSTHPEDRDDASDKSSVHNDKDQAENYHIDSDDDNSHRMSTLTTTRTSYHIPSHTSYANTGPKGVIADAQSFARAKQSTFRQRLASIANSTFSFNKPTITTTKPKSSESDSDNEASLSLSEDEADSEFMTQWRQARLTELQSKSNQATRRVSPSRRTWGTVTPVDAIGYLDAVEKCQSDTTVVVMIYDPLNERSREVEEELERVAEKWYTTRFVKLEQEIAEMEYVDVPALLAYREGEVVGTFGGVQAEGLEGVLLGNGILT